MSGPGGADPERLLADALRAQATGAPRSPLAPGLQRRSTGGRRRADRHSRLPPRWILLVAVLVGVALGVALALVSIWAPGVLPVFG